METTHYLTRFDAATEYTTVYTFRAARGQVTIERRSAVAEDEDCSACDPDFGGAYNVQTETLGTDAARARYRALRAQGYR